MEKKALISISSMQKSRMDDKIEVLTPGSYFKKMDSYHVEYEETEISGMEGTRTLLEIFPDKLSLIRQGTTSATMEFEKNNNYITMYNTPYGAMELEIHTRDLTVDVNDEGGEIFVKYNMKISGQKAEDTQLKISIKTQ